MYPGDPLDPNSWSEISSGNEPGDRRGISATGPYQFNPGDTVQIDLAFVFARDYAGNNLTSVSLLKQRIQELINYYQNDSTPCGHSWSEVKEFKSSETGIYLYPNPVHENLVIEADLQNKKGYYSIYNSMGQEVQKGIITKEKTGIQVSGLIGGYYILHLFSGSKSFSRRFIKD